MTTIDLADPSSLGSLDDGELEALVLLAIEEQRTRALERNDINALIEEGFESGFSSLGAAKDPWLHGGLLVCMGSRLDKSGTSHTCSFVHVGEDWVWESGEKVYDSVRNIPGPKPQMRSVTVLTAYEGLEIDLIASRTRGGVHEMVSAKSFTIKNGELVAVSVRSPKVNRHR